MIEVQARMAEALEGMRQRHPDETVAAASHADPIRAILMLYLGMPLEFVHRIEISTASVSVVRLRDGGPQVIRVNDTGELP